MKETNTTVDSAKLTFLPLGSVVRLKGGKLRIAVIGYTPIEKGKTEVWDYLGAVWPMGVITSDNNLLFNRDQIEEVVFEGFTDSAEIEFRTKLEKAVEEIKKR
ncbi:MAG: DUF4176 domain-containing protein [Bacilli bacterium]|nr:DUF4176 domain-containing protein [Bacilli bacterium]